MRQAALCAALAAGAALGHTSSNFGNIVIEGGGKALVANGQGTFVTDDDGATWQWFCDEAATGELNPTRAHWFVSPQGSWFVWGDKGLSVSRDGRCTFDRLANFASTAIGGLTANGAALWAVTQRYAENNGLFRSDDDGRTWTGPVIASTTEFFSSVKFAPSQPARVYVSSWWFDPDYSMIVYRSDDGGSSFTRTDLTAQLPEKGSFYVQAVHPLNPDVVLASLTGKDVPYKGLVLRSSDGGATWSLVLDAPVAVTEVVFSADGSKAWVAAGNNFYESLDSGQSFSLLSKPSRIVCASFAGGAIYSTGNELIDGWAAGKKTPPGDFAAFMTWPQVQGPKSCPAGTTVGDTCPAIWPTVSKNIDCLRGDTDQFCSPTADGGGGGAGGSGGGGAGPNPCGCSSAPPALFFAASMLAILKRRRKRW